MINKKPWWKCISPLINLSSASLAGDMPSSAEVSQHDIKHGNKHWQRVAPHDKIKNKKSSCSRRTVGTVLVVKTTKTHDNCEFKCGVMLHCFNTPGINIPKGSDLCLKSIDLWNVSFCLLFSTGRSEHKVNYSTADMGIQCLPQWHLSAARCLRSLFQPKKRSLKSLPNLLLSGPFTSLKVKGAIKKNMAL